MFCFVTDRAPLLELLLFALFFALDVTGEICGLCDGLTYLASCWLGNKPLVNNDRESIKPFDKTCQCYFART